MKPLAIGEYDTNTDILSRKDLDNNKYKFSFYQDISWGWMSEDVQKQLDIYYENNDVDKFIELYNKHNSEEGGDGLFKLVKIINMKGPGGGWPEVILATNKFVTIKELVNIVGEEYLNDYAFELSVDAIEEV